MHRWFSKKNIMHSSTTNRRKFISRLGAATLATGLLQPGTSFAGRNARFADDNINHIGPKEGFSPQIGTLISMLDWNTDSMINATKGLTVDQLDHLHDPDSNSIGSLILHVAATEVIYQDLTFAGLADFSEENKKTWGVAMELGADAREKIKGHPIDFYVNALRSARARTKEELRKKDDVWLLGGETKAWNWNNYCKWFHVVEHYSNHRGQITWYRKRLPK